MRAVDLTNLPIERAMEVAGADYDATVERLLRHNEADLRRDGLADDDIEAVLKWQRSRFMADRAAHLKQVYDWLLDDHDDVSYSLH